MQNITSDELSATFLTSMLRSRVVHKHRATVDAELGTHCVNGTCRYNDGRKAGGSLKITLSRGTSLAQDVGQPNEKSHILAKR